MLSVYFHLKGNFMRLWRVLLLVSVVVVLGMLPAHAGNRVPRFEEDDCPFDSFGPVEPDCGYLIVPESRSDPDSPLIRLAVAVFPAQSRNAADDPLIYLDGGPGGFTLDVWGANFSSFAPFARDRDVILFDQRGTGHSEPSLFCDETIEFSLDTLDDELTDAEISDGYFDALSQCLERVQDDGVNLEAYNSAENAADVVDLWQTLGYDEVNLLGISYGSRLALTIMRDHPDEIRSVIIEGVYPPQVDRSADNIINADRAFDELFAACADDDDCDAAFPDLETVFYDTARALNDDPQMISVMYPTTGETYDMLLTGDGFVSTVFSSLYATWLIPGVPQMIYAASEGDYSDVEFYSSLLDDGMFTFSDGLYFMVECNDEIPFNEVEDTVEAAEQFPEVSEFWVSEDFVGEQDYYDMCVEWGGELPDEIENEPISSDIPTLVFSGQFDPVTPARWADIAAETLPNSYNYVFPSIGHGASVSGDECPLEMALEFVDDPSEAPDDDCIEDMEAHFTTPIISVELEEFSTSEVSGVYPDGWEEVNDGYFIADETYVTTLFYVVTDEDEEYVEYLVEFYGVDELPDADESIEANGREWDIYRFEAEQYTDYIILAVSTERDGTQYLILITSGSEAEDELLYNDLLLPALEVFEVD
jgi:pimeloyl-ACP methyl ester carboxylesterase